MQMPPDFPPVPKCFSHLLNVPSSINIEHEEQMVLSQSLPAGTSFDLQKCYVRSFSDSQDMTVRFRNPFYQEVFASQYNHYNDNGRDQYPESLTAQNIKTVCALGPSNSNASSSHKHRPVLTKQSSMDEPQDDACEPDLSNPFVKLNSSLEKLQKEMKELRLFDFSLFCQLLSLHESIQDIKFNVGDRYSETGSEYSLGSASYMGSMSSLDEESDWGDNQVFMHSFRGEESAADEEETRQSTSSLLEKISALTQRAEEEI